MTEERQTTVIDPSYQAAIDRLKAHRILLVGGAGFIGHNLALELGRHGQSVMVADNLMMNNLVQNVSSTQMAPVQRQLYQNFLLDRFILMRDAGINFRNVDARNSMEIARVFDEFQPTKIVHLAAIASAVAARKDPGLAFDLQLITFRNVLEHARLSHGKVNQVMFMSSSTVYGDFDGAEVDETTRPRPEGIYANSKYMGERLARTYATQHNVPSVIIRPSALYGERCVSRRVSQVFIENALSVKPLLLEGGGDGRLDFTYVKDLVDGMVRALAIECDAGYTNTFNLTFGNARTVAELATVVKSIVPEANLEERPRAVDKPIRGTLSTQRATQVLGFRASWPIESGYRRYCEWYTAEWRKAEAQCRSAS
ncbi:MAG: NAD(P)-dependent oxidoreductase [Alphaproteobacteria bacterium]|nr:NAD(P)-dependent oxidoreductase [Alphaproteobacteria bacterium]